MVFRAHGAEQRTQYGEKDLPRGPDCTSEINVYRPKLLDPVCLDVCYHGAFNVAPRRKDIEVRVIGSPTIEPAEIGGSLTHAWIDVTDLDTPAPIKVLCATKQSVTDCDDVLHSGNFGHPVTTHAILGRMLLRMPHLTLNR